VHWFRGGLVFQAHRLCVSLNSRLESNKEEEDQDSKQLRSRKHHAWRRESNPQSHGGGSPTIGASTALVFKALRLCVSLNSSLESDKGEAESIGLWHTFEALQADKSNRGEYLRSIHDRSIYSTNLYQMLFYNN